MSKTGTTMKIILFIVLTPVLIGAGIYAIVNVVDYAERRFSPEEYWGRKVTDEEINLSSLDQALRDCLIRLQMDRRTYPQDIARSVNAGITNQDAITLANIVLEAQMQECTTVATMRKRSAESLVSYRDKAAKAKQ
jgi:hypothetical protein